MMNDYLLVSLWCTNNSAIKYIVLTGRNIRYHDVDLWREIRIYNLLYKENHVIFFLSRKVYLLFAVKKVGDVDASVSVSE